MRTDTHGTAFAGLGFRAQKGGAVAIGLVVQEGKPRVIASTFLRTYTDDDRLSFEPYGVATEIMSGLQKGTASAEAEAAVTEGRRRQEQHATEGLQGIIRQMEEAGCKPAVAALLINRSGWVTDLLAYSASWPEHVPVAEALAVREALRAAFHHCGIEVVEWDEKSLPNLATEKLDMAPEAIDACLKEMGTTVGRPWRKEQKLACLSAWVAVT